MPLLWLSVAVVGILALLTYNGAALGVLSVGPIPAGLWFIVVFALGQTGLLK